MTVTTEEAAEAAGVSTAQIRKWVMLGWLVPVRRGARPMRFRYDEVARCQRQHRTKAWDARHAEAVNVWESLQSRDS